jgi:hypothetical protein
MGLFQKIEEKKPCLYVHGFLNIHSKMVQIIWKHNLFPNEKFLSWTKSICFWENYFESKFQLILIKFYWKWIRFWIFFWNLCILNNSLTFTFDMYLNNKHCYHFLWIVQTRYDIITKCDGIESNYPSNSKKFKLNFFSLI